MNSSTPEFPIAATSEFLKKIKAEGIKKYAKINELFVPPVEYDSIKKALNENRIVFIIGSKEYGKTYSSVRLLWEFFTRGYEPLWFKGDKEQDRINVRAGLANIEVYMKPHSIIYFEDPFGKSRYEVMIDDQITRNIANIIDITQSVDDTYVIITSREEVFKEFERKLISEQDLGKFKKNLILKTPSYNYDKRKEMLFNWANEQKCKWLHDEYLKDLVLQSIKDENNLPTPLNIEQFSLATVSILDKSNLLEKLEAKSRETAKSFAEEIKAMTADKMLFLSFLFISDWFEIDFIRSRYHILVIKLGLIQPWDFDRIMDWFKDDKISIRDGKIGFSHSSFSESLEYLLNDDGHPSNFSIRIFSQVLRNLLSFHNLSKNMTKIIIQYIEYLPPSYVRFLISRLGERKARRAVFDSLIINNRFCDRNILEVLSTEDRFLLFCIINNGVSDKIAVKKGFKWNRILSNLLYIERRFRYSVYEKFLLVCCSNPELSKTKTSYHKKMFEYLIEYKIKRMIREKYLVLIEDIFSDIKSDSNVLEIRRCFNFMEISDEFVIALLKKLVAEGFIHVSKSGRLVKRRRKLAESIAMESKLDMHARILCHVTSITKYLDRHYSYVINRKAISWANEVTGHPLLEGKEPLNVAAELVFLAGKQFGIKKLADYIHDETGVSKPYLYNHQEEYTRILKG